MRLLLWNNRKINKLSKSEEDGARRKIGGKGKKNNTQMFRGKRTVARREKSKKDGWS